MRWVDEGFLKHCRVCHHCGIEWGGEVCGDGPTLSCDPALSEFISLTVEVVGGSQFQGYCRRL